MRSSSRAMPSGGRIESTEPAATAARGMSGNLAVSSWANVMPPSDLIALRPRAPSESVPDKMTPIARILYVSARDSKK